MKLLNNLYSAKMIKLYSCSLVEGPAIALLCLCTMYVYVSAQVTAVSEGVSRVRGKRGNAEYELYFKVRTYVRPGLIEIKWSISYF